MSLSKKQRIFCEEYVGCGNGKESAIRAGYSAKTAISKASQLLADQDVKRYIKELQEKIKNDKILDARQMQEILTSIILQTSKEEVVLMQSDGDGGNFPTRVFKTASQADRIKAIQLLAKMQGALDNTATVNVVLPVFGGESELED